MNLVTALFRGTQLETIAGSNRSVISVNGRCDAAGCGSLLCPTQAQAYRKSRQADDMKTHCCGR